MESQRKQTGLPNHKQVRNVHNPTYATADEPVDLPTNLEEHTSSAIPNADYNSITLNASHNQPATESKYSHINNGLTSATVNEATYFHIPRSEIPMVDYTYSHILTKQNSTQNQHYIEGNSKEERDSTYNHLGDEHASHLNSNHTTRSHTDNHNTYGIFENKKTYAHICLEKEIRQHIRTNSYDDDPTYNHLDEIL